MRYPNSEMISTYAGYAEGTHHHCEVLLRDDSIVVEYVDDGTRVTVKVRNSFRPAAATVFAGPDRTAEVILDASVDGVAPGQACVFYDGDHMLGGGWIIRG